MTQRTKKVCQIYSALTYLLTLTLILKFGNTLVSFKLISEHFLWVTYDFLNLFDSLFLSLIVFVFCDRKHIFTKMVVFASFIFNVCILTQYLVLISIPWLFTFTFLLFCCVIIPIIYKYVLFASQPKQCIYNPKDCFLALKKPKNVIGFISSIITAPYGHCSLVISGQEFMYKQGILIERKFNYSNDLTFKQLQFIDIQDCRKLLGKKWSLRNNCFSTFSKYPTDL
jgi:hypothetical protein